MKRQEDTIAYKFTKLAWGEEVAKRPIWHLAIVIGAFISLC